MLKCYFINIDHGKQILKLMAKDIHIESKSWNTLSCHNNIQSVTNIL